MARKPDRYSRLIGWLKILLPLIALGILSTLFLVSRQAGTDGALPYGQVNVEELAREEGIGAPAYRAVTDSGTMINIIAASARPPEDRTGALLAQELHALIESPDGLVTEVAATEGAIDGEAEKAVLTGDVRVATSTGYVMTTGRLDLGLDTASVRSPGALKASGPMGEITAGAMSLEGEDGVDAPLVFNRGVELIYKPDPASEAP